MAPVRVELTVELARAFGLLDAAGVTVAVAEPASIVELELVHDARYISAVRQASAGKSAGMVVPPAGWTGTTGHAAPDA